MLPTVPQAPSSARGPPHHIRKIQTIPSSKSARHVDDPHLQLPVSQSLVLLSRSPRRPVSLDSGPLAPTFKRLQSEPTHTGGYSAPSALEKLREGVSLSGGPSTSSVARAEETLLKRQKARAEMADQYVKLRQQMRPPPTMTLADLERHPLKGDTTRRYNRNDADDGAGVDTRPRDEGPLGGFISQRTGYTDVKGLLNAQIIAAEARMLFHKQARQVEGRKSPRSNRSSSRERVAEPFQGEEEEGKAFFLTDLPLSDRLDTETPKNRPPSHAQSKGRSASFHLGGANDQPIALSVSSLGPEFDERCLERDPKEFRKAGQESRHAQHYRHGTIEVKTIGFPRPTNEESSADEVGLFMRKLKNRDHHFNNAVMEELRRAREAQSMFFKQKADAIDHTISHGDRRSAPAPQLLGDVRKTIRQEAVAKDQGERLEVFYDHLRRLNRFATSKFPKGDLAPLAEILGATRSLVEAKDGLVSASDFTSVWKSFKGLFTREAIMELHTRDLLRMLSLMFGISHETFRAWLHKKMRRYDPRDFQAVFRSEDVAMGKEAQDEARLRLALTGGRHICTKDWSFRSQTYIRVCVEDLVICSPTILDVGTKSSVSLKSKPSVLNLNDEGSAVRVQVVEEDRMVGEGVFHVSGFAPGRPLKMWLPTPGPNMPNAEVEMQVEVLPPRPPPAPTSLRSGGTSPLKARSANSIPDFTESASVMLDSSDDDM